MAAAAAAEAAAAEGVVMVMVTVVMLPRFSLVTETGSMGTNIGAVGFSQEDDMGRTTQE